MTIDEVFKALDKVRDEFVNQKYIDAGMMQKPTTKGGYFRVGNVAIKIAEITELK